MSVQGRSRFTSPLRIAPGLFAALLLSVPFVIPVNGLPVSTFYQEWIAVGLGCMAFLAILLSPGNAGLAIPRLVVLPLGILLLLMVQIGAGKLVYWQQGAVAAMYLVWSAAILCVGITLRRRYGWQDFCRVSAWFVLIGALVSAVAGIVQLLDWQTGGVVASMIGPRVHANLGQPNHFANLLCLGLCAVVYLSSAGRLHVGLAAGIAVTFLALANLSGSRSVWLYIAALVMLAIWTHRGSKSTQSRILVYWVAALLALMLFVQWIAGILLEESALRHVMTGERVARESARTSERLISWSAAWLMFTSSPVWGVGFKAFAWNYFGLIDSLSAGAPERITDHAHNIVLQMLAEFGLAGGLLAIGGAALWWMGLLRGKASLERWWVSSVVAIVCVHSLLEYPLWYAYFLGPFALFVGAGDQVLWRAGSALYSRTIVVAICVVVIWTLGVVFHDYRRVERLGSLSAQTQVISESRDEIARIARSTLFLDLVELGVSRTISVDPTNLDAKVSLNARVLQANPAPDVAYRHSALLALAGDLDGSIRLWDMSQAAYPSRAAGVAAKLGQSSAAGAMQLAPLVEYAASRNKD